MAINTFLQPSFIKHDNVGSVDVNVCVELANVRNVKRWLLKC